MGDHTDTAHSTPVSPNKRRTTHASRACDMCRHRKVRCVGYTCERCTRYGIECIRTGTDERRKPAQRAESVARTRQSKSSGSRSLPLQPIMDTLTAYYGQTAGPPMFPLEPFPPDAFHVMQFGPAVSPLSSAHVEAYDVPPPMSAGTEQTLNAWSPITPGPVAASGVSHASYAINFAEQPTQYSLLDSNESKAWGIHYCHNY